MLTGQDELAAADQWQGQGAQVLLLDELPTDHGRLAQLLAQLGQIEGLGAGRHHQHQAQRQERPYGKVADHASARSTASTKTFGEASCISRLAISTATCTLVPRVMRSPVSASLIR